MNNHKIVLPAYGDHNEWSPRLGTFLKHLRKHEPDREVMLISDGRSNWPDSALHGLEMWEVPAANDVPTYSYLNMSGILLAHAAINLSPCLVMTLDCEVKRPIEWGEWTKSDIAFGRDRPPERVRHIAGEAFTEFSVAVGWFLCALPGYAFLRDWVKHGEEGNAINCNFWEQTVWSYTWLCYDPARRAVYPEEMNWSHTVRGGNPIVVHYHGLGAKERFDQL